MPNSEIELHDSTVAAIAKVGEQVIVFFSGVYIHTSEGRVGWDAGSGWWQAAALTFASASVEGDVGELPADILDGDLVLDGQLLENNIPIPFSHEGDIALQIFLKTSETVIVRGSQADLTLLGEAVYVEEFPGESVALTAA